VKKYGPPASGHRHVEPAGRDRQHAVPAPQSGVWLSLPSRVWPGTEKLSMLHLMAQMPLPGLEKTAPYFRETACM